LARKRTHRIGAPGLDKGAIAIVSDDLGLLEKVAFPGDTAGTAGIGGKNYFEGWLNLEGYRMEVHQAGGFPTFCHQGIAAINFSGARLRGAVRSFGGRSGSYKRDFAEAAVIG
jgi:hypothetical protein